MATPPNKWNHHRNESDKDLSDESSNFEAIFPSDDEDETTGSKDKATLFFSFRRFKTKL